MRVLGMFLLGLGITLLIPSGFALSSANDLSQLLGFLLCTALIPVPMIVGGILIVRRLEDRAAPPPEDPEDARVPETGDAAGSTLARMRGFELNRLNWIGWLLLLLSFGLVIAGSLLGALAFGNGAWGGRATARIIALPLLFLAIGFFAGLRWLLRKLGVSIYRW